MNRKDLYNSFNEIDDDILERSEAATQRKKKPVWIKWGAVAACLCLIISGLFPMFNQTGASPFVLTAYAMNSNTVSAVVMQEGESVPVSMFETESGTQGFVFSYDNADSKQSSSISVMTEGPFPGVITEIIGLNLNKGKNYLFYIPAQTQDAPYTLMIPHTDNDTVYEFHISIDKTGDGYMATIEQIVTFEQKLMP